MTSVTPTLSPTPSLLVHVFGQRATAMPHALAYAVYPKGARQAAQRITWGELHSASRAFAARLLIAGVRAGDRIAIHAGNRPLWPLADLAVQMVGAIGVGIFPASAPSQVEAMLADAQPVLAITDTAAAFATVREARDRLGANFPIVGEGDGEGNSTGQPGGAAQRWEAWRTEGQMHLNASAILRAELDARIAALALDDIAALIYTSGSTGEPKGALISHRCLAASAQSIAMVLELQSSDSSVSFLPFSHAAGRVFGQCTRIHAGMASALVEDPADVFAASADFQPTLFGALPRIFERLYEATEIARRDGTSARDAITQRIGARCRIATSGGAALPARIALELEALGLPVLGAYGQTEHLCVAMYRRDCLDADTVCSRCRAPWFASPLTVKCRFVAARSRSVAISTSPTRRGTRSRRMVNGCAPVIAGRSTASADCASPGVRRNSLHCPTDARLPRCPSRRNSLPHRSSRMRCVTGKGTSISSRCCHCVRGS